MLGHFLTLYASGHTTKLQSQEELHQLPAGSPIVALSSPESLLTGSLGKEILFAIVSDKPGHLIAQQVVADSEEGVEFEIQEFPAAEHLHYYTYETNRSTTAEVLQRAKSRLQQCYHRLRSYPGDDFVEECLSGLDIVDILAQQPEEIGQHWWTPLEVTPKEVLDDLQEAIQRELATTPTGGSFMEIARRKIVNKKLQDITAKIREVTPAVLMNITLPQLEHHAILIEGGQSVIFAGGTIRHMSKKSFCNITPNTPIGGPAKGSPQGKTEIDLRLIARNRAIRQLCREGATPGEWGDFNLLLNNSEHFCRYCRNGKAYCTQLTDKTISALKAILGMILPGWLAVAIDIIIDKFFPPQPGEHAPMN